MPHQVHPPEPSDAELLQELLGEVHAFLPLLDREEIRSFLEGLREGACAESERLREFSRLEEERLEAIRREVRWIPPWGEERSGARRNTPRCCGSTRR